MDDLPKQAPVDPKLVGRRLVAVRAALEMQQGEFAEAIGIDKSSFSKIEKGKKPLLPPYAYRIYELFGVDLNFIYMGQPGGLPNKLSAKVISHLNGAQQ